MDNKKAMKQMAKMVDSVQPHCDEPIKAAMTCSHAGTMTAFLASKLLGGGGVLLHNSKLPNPVFIAVGENTIYAFDYAPRGFNFKIKKEVARWPRNEVKVAAEVGRGMANFAIATNAGENYAFEMPIMMGGKDVVLMFFEVLGVPQST